MKTVQIKELRIGDTVVYNDQKHKVMLMGGYGSTIEVSLKDLDTLFLKATDTIVLAG